MGMRYAGVDNRPKDVAANKYFLFPADGANGGAVG